MRQLYIDGKPAVIKSGTSFKFYRENIYFTDAEDYTLDVTLPLQGCPENLAIFSAIHRPEMSAVHLIGKKYPFHFIAPPLDITGSAIVTEINEMEVKVQLLAGGSAIKYDDAEWPGSEAWIDELDLGQWYDITNPGITDYKGILNSVERHATYDNNPDQCVCFPVYAKGDSMRLNEHAWRRHSWYERDKTTYIEYLAHEDTFKIRDSASQFSAQPYLLLILERVLKAVGYTLDPNNHIAHSWQRNLFIVSGRNEFRYNRILPHWTVAEFLREVSIFCGVIFVREGTTFRTIRKAEYYSSIDNAIHLAEILDEHSTEIATKEEDSEHISTANVGYDFESIDPLLRLDDEVWNKAIVIPVASPGEHQYHVNEADRHRSEWLFTVEITGRAYAYLKKPDGSYQLYEVDQMGNIYRDDRRELDISMRIVPVRSFYDSIFVYWTGEGAVETEPDVVLLNEYIPRYPTLYVDGASTAHPQYYSVNDILSGTATSVSPPERIEVAYNSGGNIYMDTIQLSNGEDFKLTMSFPYATGVPYIRKEDNVNFTALQPMGGDNYTSWQYLTLKKAISGGMYDILSAGAEIDTRVRHCFQFLDNIDPNPKVPFIIRGRKYACEKIEYTCEDEGVSPIKRGYFYEIND